jgi:hypothetical protein
MGRSAVRELTTADKFNAPGLLKIVAGRLAWLVAANVWLLQCCSEYCQGTGACLHNNNNNNKELTVEIQSMCDVKTKVIPVLIGATGTISKSLTQYLSKITRKHEI